MGLCISQSMNDKLYDWWYSILKIKCLWVELVVETCVVLNSIQFNSMLHTAMKLKQADQWVYTTRFNSDHHYPLRRDYVDWYHEIELWPAWNGIGLVNLLIVYHLIHFHLQVCTFIVIERVDVDGWCIYTNVKHSC